MFHRLCIEFLDRAMKLLRRITFFLAEKCCCLLETFDQFFQWFFQLQGSNFQRICQVIFLYDSFKILRLTKNMRLQTLLQDSAVAEKAVKLPQFLLHVGDGRVPAQ